MDVQRTITEHIEKRLFGDKVIIIYGPRRTGKTTIIKHLAKKYQQTHRVKYILCEDLSAQQALSAQEGVKLKQYLGDIDLVFLDEAQNIKNIGINLKILVDTYPEIQIVATGSSSFDLANEIKEPLTGRAWEFFLPPFSLEELEQQYKRNELYGLLDILLTYGSYPQVIDADLEDKPIILEGIAQNYLYKDILQFEGQKNAPFIRRLLQLLAFQIGQEVSINELAQKLERNKTTIEKYLFLLEQTFVIFRLPPLSRNLRKEVVSKNKVYFWDVGIRNSLIQNFNETRIRPDIGVLWENFCIAERLKYLRAHRKYANSYFWRLLHGSEIDYVEEYNGSFKGYEVKWEADTFRKPREFLEGYADSRVDLVNKWNVFDFIQGW
jgi:hypothetical protein